MNISNCEGLHVSGLAINYYGLTPSRSGHPGITYNLLNSSNVVSEDVTIYKAPFFSVTAFNGGGGHIFRRFHMPNDTAVNPANGRPSDPWPHQRDAFHFTDLRPVCLTTLSPSFNRESAPRTRVDSFVRLGRATQPTRARSVR